MTKKVIKLNPFKGEALFQFLVKNKKDFEERMNLDTNGVMYKTRIREVLELLPSRAIGRRAW